MASILDLLLTELQGLSAQSPELAQACAPLMARVSTPPVSYTHLTLPTICSV